MRRSYLFIACLLLMGAIFSCRNNSPNGKAVTDPNQLSPDLVNIQSSASTSPPGKLPKMVFTDTNFDFGTITEGDKVTHAFQFKNMGEGDLIVTGAAATCGCTTPTYTHMVKHPGDTGTISVTFDSSNLMGKHLKTITVSSNSQPPYRFLTININIQPPKN